MTPFVGQAPLNAFIEATNATFPAPAASAMVPVASGVGKVVPTEPPLASAIRKYWPGCRTTFGNLVTSHDVPAALAYCTLRPFRFTAVADGLKSSIKSF